MIGPEIVHGSCSHSLYIYQVFSCPWQTWRRRKYISYSVLAAYYIATDYFLFTFYIAGIQLPLADLEEEEVYII